MIFFEEKNKTGAENDLEEKQVLIYGFDYKTNKDTTQKIRMQLLSNPKYLKPFRNFVYDISIAYGLKKEIAFEIKIMANESLQNIIKHSYQNILDGWIFFEYLFYQTYIEIRFRDFGKKKFNPKELVPKDLKDFRDSGLGLYIISKLSDYHYFKHMEELGTLLVIKKRII